MKNRLLLIINPHSGDGIAKRWIFDMVDTLSLTYKFVTVYLSRCTGDIKKTVSSCAGEYDAVICCGGDGTLNEVLNGLCAAKVFPEVGYIPTGTVNDFASSHKIPKSIKLAINRLSQAEPHEYDAGLLGQTAFTYVAAFGAFTDVAYMTPQNAKASLGIAAYLAEAAIKLPEIKPIRLSYTSCGRTVEGEYIFGMISNSVTVGGIKFFSGEASEYLNDGRLEITLVKYPRTNAEFQEAIRGMLTPGMSTASVEKFSAESISFKFNKKIPWTADGEFGGEYEEVTAGILPHKFIILE